MRFCQTHNLHLVIDEIFALSGFICPDDHVEAPFASALSLDAAALGCDPSRVHVVWSPSKDFGSSAIRLVGSRGSSDILLTDME